mgnify:CR=1 FL=1|tara:strand:- start:45 stop:209 length:165 start_codon:yes stop_codon:yes gene_type:complete
MSDPITVSYEETLICTLQFESEAEFEDWQDQGSVLRDLHPSQILTERHHMEVSQ